MIIPCFRCNKEIETPDASNADYVIAQDTITREAREVLVALKHNQKTLAKVAKKKEVITPDVPIEDAEGNPRYPDLVIDDSEYDAVEVPDIATAQKQFGEDFVKVIVEVREKDIQKTGIICPNCYRDTDFVIWGVHKKK